MSISTVCNILESRLLKKHVARKKRKEKKELQMKKKKKKISVRISFHVEVIKYTLITKKYNESIFKTMKEKTLCKLDCTLYQKLLCFRL